MTRMPTPPSPKRSASLIPRNEALRPGLLGLCERCGGSSAHQRGLKGLETQIRELGGQPLGDLRRLSAPDRHDLLRQSEQRAPVVARRLAPADVELGSRTLAGSQEAEPGVDEEFCVGGWKQFSSDVCLG